MELVDKIHAEIAKHESELGRLKTALAVIESLSGKPPAKKGPLISVSGVSHQAGAHGGDFTAPKVPKEKRLTNEVVREKILEALAKQPMNSSELKKYIGAKLLATRSKNAVAGCLNYLKVTQGLIHQQKEDKRYALNAYAPQFPAPEIVEPDTAPELEGEAA